MSMPANPNRANNLFAVLTASLEAAAFGVLCAGLLLWSHQITLSFIHVASHWLARFIFLSVVGGAFGFAAGITPMLSRIVAELRRKH